MNKTEVKQVCNKVYFDAVTSHRDGRETFYNDNRTEIIDNIPHVWPIGLSNNQVYVVCPYCNKIHHHGLANGKYEGVVRSHCEDNEVSNAYCIERLFKCIGVNH